MNKCRKNRKKSQKTMKKHINIRIFGIIIALFVCGIAAIEIEGQQSGKSIEEELIQRAEEIIEEREVENREEILGNIKEWIDKNEYQKISEFIERLQDREIYEIIKAAEKGRIVSDEGVPVAIDPEVYGQKTLLSLPVSGVWNIVQGNNGLVSHLKGGKGEFAWDFVIVRGGQQAEGNANVNDTHYCWGQPVVAPAPGLVVRVRDDLEDHAPYTPDPPREGNQVYIDHENGEISLLHHLMKDSAMVEVGDRVKRGQPVGLCGDTGISMFPHLHFDHFKGTLENHERFESHFFGYYSWRTEPDEPGKRPEKMRLNLAGIPRRLEFVMNAGEYLDNISEQ